MHGSQKLAALMAKVIAKGAPVIAVVLPTLCIITMVIGFNKTEYADDVRQFWIRDSTDLKKNSDYKFDLIGGPTVSAVASVTTPHHGDQVLTASGLLQLRDSLSRVEQVWLVKDGINFTYRDLCLAPLPYLAPCMRTSVVDCFYEGGYDFNQNDLMIWRSGAANAQSAAQLPIASTAISKMAMAETQCDCNNSLLISDLPTLSQGKWADDSMPTACVECIDATWTQANGESAYYAKLEEMSGSPGKTSAEYDAWLQGALFQQAMAGLVAAAVHPYNGRPMLQEEDGTLMSEADVLKHASGRCTLWDGGAFFPPLRDILTFGGDRPDGWNSTHPMTGAAAILQTNLLLVPNAVVQKMVSPTRPGGAVNVSTGTAEEALADMKILIEDILNSNWDNPSFGPVEIVSYSDNEGSTGTSERVMPGYAKDAFPVSFGLSVVALIFSMLMFTNTSCTKSRTLLVAAGTIYVILGAYAAIALTSWWDIKLDMVSMWIVPFLLIGIGVDDMYILTISEEAVEAGPNVEETFARVFANVAVPITLTSLINMGMFLVLALAIDLPAMYQTGYSGIMGVIWMFLTVVISYPSLLYLDMKRRNAGRRDWIFIKGSQPSGVVEGKMSGKAEPNFVFTSLYSWIYKPLISTWVGSVTILALATFCVVFSCFQLHDFELGFKTTLFFAEGTPHTRFSEVTEEYFLSFPIEMNWGAIAYNDPEIQMKMAWQFERIIEVPKVAGEGMVTSLVWTAALAHWCVPEQYAVASPCAGRVDSYAATPTPTCGPKVNPICTATWKENTHNLRLASEGGICYEGSALGLGEGEYCPVLELSSQEEMVQCIAAWRSASNEYSVINPNMPLQADSVTPWAPIGISIANGGALFAYDLTRTEAFLDLIRDTRKFMDDDPLHAWMSGTPYDFYEQYLTIVEVIVWVGSITCIIGWIIGCLFLFLQLTVENRGSILSRCTMSLVGSLLISMMSGCSLVVTLGYVAWTEVKVNGIVAMPCILSVGFAVEYAVHTMHRFIESPPGTAAERIDHSMKGLFRPMCLAFATTLGGVCCMLFAPTPFVTEYYFIPLAVACFTSYFFGAFCLPALLQMLPFLPALAAQGVPSAVADGSREEDKSAAVHSKVDVYAP